MDDINIILQYTCFKAVVLNLGPQADQLGNLTKPLIYSTPP